MRTLLIALLAMTATPLAAEAPTVPAAAPQVDHQRALGLTGASNFRDLGGYATADGRHVRWGRIYRSNGLSELTPEDMARVDKLGLAAVVDLRSAEERTQKPSRWLHRPASYYESPKTDLAPVMNPILADAATPEGARAGMTRVYELFPELYREEYAALFRKLAAGEGPLLFHCSAGKDRTGVAAALLLTALGVPREAVLADFALTEQFQPPMRKVLATTAAPGGLKTISALPEESRAIMWRADPGYVEVALDYVARRYGSVQGYLKDALGLTDIEVAALRRNLTE